MSNPELTNEEKIEAALTVRIDRYRKGNPSMMDEHAALVLEHFRNCVVKPMADVIRAHRRAEQEIARG